MNNLESYTPEEFQRERNLLFRRLIVPPQPSPQSNPRAILLGGQSGAGKTTLHQILRERFKGNVIVINGDEYRSRHPRFHQLDAAYGADAVSYTAAWSGAMTEALIDSFSTRRYNLVIEGTLRTAEVPLRTAAKLRERGYTVGLALMAVKPEISLISCQIRYEQMRLAGTTPRATDPNHHRLIIDGIVSNLTELESSGVFESIELFTRDRTRIYPTPNLSQKEDVSLANTSASPAVADSPSVADSPNTASPSQDFAPAGAASQPNAASALREALFGPWTLEEKAHYADLQELLITLKKH